MTRHIATSLLYTAIMAVVLGLGYPLALTAIAQLAFPSKANGELLYNSQGVLIGSALIGQSFTGDRYFNSRPSAAGTGYDASSSSGSNLGPTSKAMREREEQAIAAEKQLDVPVDLVTASASGLDPDITPAAALFQVARVAQARHLGRAQVQALVEAHTTPRELGMLGDPRVNVLLLNEALNKLSDNASAASR